jgi:hypothetical protein
MRSQSEASKIQNPFGVMDVPDPNDAEVTEFAGRATRQESADDDNAQAWSNADRSRQHGTIEGHWSSRWNGGADPTVPGDTADQWKPGRAELRTARDRVYLLFDWDSGARKGLIDAQLEGSQRLVGKYINLGNPAITRPWIGQIVNDRRIDGRWTEGRLDFRR